MSRPTRALSMARVAGAALLAAVEIYNKPVVQYREQTFSILMVNAWEILLKARLVQQANGKLPSIYRKLNGGRKYQRHHRTREPMTIGLSESIPRLGLQGEIVANVDGLEAIRNISAHVGVFESDLANRVREFGSAAIRNFIYLSGDWFGEAPNVGYLLPVAFIENATVKGSPSKGKQRDLLNFLGQLVAAASVDKESDYAVTMKVDVNLDRGLSGGGSIGLTDDPSAPLVRVSDDEAVEAYPLTYKDIVTLAKSRYQGFSANGKFHGALKEVKEDTKCAYERRLNPAQANSPRQFRYREEETFRKLDRHYTRR